MNQILPIQNLDQIGVVPDAPPSALPTNAFSDARNVRFRDGAVRKIEGEVLIHAIEEDDDLDTKYGTSGNTLGAAKYIAYWPNPNLGDLNAYYIYIIAVKNSSDVHIADRVYLIDQEGNRKDLTPPSLTNTNGYKGFDPKGVWQHTLFSGGFAIIINNGIEKPHYILDPINGVDVTTVNEFSELPGWDSYNIDIEVLKLTWDSNQGDTFDLGQKVDFTNFYVTFNVNGTNYSVQSGSPAGTGTPNASNFVPGELPSSGIVTSSNNFEIYHSSATNTTVLASTNLVSGQEIIINIISRNNVTVRAGIIRSFGNLLVAGDLIEVDSVSGDTLRRLTGAVRTSDLAVTGSIPNNWNPFEEGVSTADEFTLSDTNIVKEMQSIQGNLYIYTNSSIHSMTLTGNENAPVSFNLVTENYGALTTEAVTEYDGKHLVVGSNDIYIFPGHPGNIQSVATGRIRDYFYKNLNPLHETKLFTLLNKAKDEIWICYPTIKSVTGELDEAIIWNYRLNNWTIRDLDEVISGDIAPIRGGGIPVSTVEMTSGNSGSDTALNTGQQEVQTMTITGQMEASHAGIKQVQEVSIVEPQYGYNERISGAQHTAGAFGGSPANPPYEYHTKDRSFSADQPETISIDLNVNSGPNISEESFSVTIGNATYGVIDIAKGDTLFTRSSAPFGGLEIKFQLINNTIPTDVLITAADLFPTNDGLAKTQQQTVEALADYINDLPSSHPMSDYTATAVEYYHSYPPPPSAYRLELESTVPGERSISQANSYINAYVGGLIAATGTGSNQEVSVTATLQNQTITGYARGTGSLVPYYDTNKGFDLDYGNSGYNDQNGHTTGKDSINGLQVFIGGWTSAGAAGPDGSNLSNSYTVSRTGNLYFIVSGAGGAGADHNFGGGAASAVQGYIAAQAGDIIYTTSGFAPRRDTYGGGAGGGGASRIRWYRGSSLLADITAPGGKGAPSNSTPAGLANAVTPATAPSGVVYTRVLRGEGSTGTVQSGETDRGGSRNGGRGFFTFYGSNLYNGRWSPSSLSWRPREANFGDGTQSHSDTPQCCTWNAVPPGVVYLWQDGVKTNFTITNNRTVGNYPLQQDLYNVTLSAGGSTIGYIPTGGSATRSVDGDFTSTLGWSGQILGTQMSSFTISGTGDATNVSGTGIDVDVTQNGSVYDINVTNNYIAPSTIATPSAIADTDFQIGEVKNLLGQASDSWTITGTYLTNTGTVASKGINTDYNATSLDDGNGIYGVSEADSPPITVRLQMSSGGYVPDGFDKRIVLSRNLAGGPGGANAEIKAGLITDVIFQGQDPRDPTSVQPSGAYFYVEDNAATGLLNLIAINPANDDVDTASISLNTLTTYNGTDYAVDKFGGYVNTSSLTTTQGLDTAQVAPTLRMSYDNTYTDVILYGTNIHNKDIADMMAQALDATGTFSATSQNVDTTYTFTGDPPYSITLTTVMRSGKVIATREQASTNSNVITVTIQNDPSGILRDSTVGTPDPNLGYFPQTMTFSQTTAGQNPSIGQGTATLTLGASAFLPAYNVVVPLTGAYNTTLSSSDIASLIRGTTISGWTLSGTGSDVIFTTDEKYSVNRTDNGLGTGAVQSLLWDMTADDDNGNFEVPSDPLQDATAVETTPGIPVRYSQPTVIRVNYSDSSFQDYVFGGASNGPLALSNPYVQDIYSGGTSNTTYSNVDIADELESEIKSIGGRTLDVERTGNDLRISPLQFSTTGLYVTSITQTYLGTTAPSVLAVTIPNPVTDATLTASYSSFGIFDPDRPWASDQVKGGTAYPIFIQTDNVDESNRVRAADVGFNFGSDPANNIIGEPYISYVERRELGITPELDTEEIARAAIQSTGGTATELDGPLYYPTLRLRMSPTNYTAEMANLQGGASVVNDYSVASTYKVDTRITGRFANYRIDDANQDPTVASNEYAWGIPSIQFEINKAGER